MTKKMLQFVDLKKENPPKRDVKKRSQDFNEIYNGSSTEIKSSIFSNLLDEYFKTLYLEFIKLF